MNLVKRLFTMDRRLENIVEDASKMDFHFSNFDENSKDLERDRIIAQVEYHRWEIDRNYNCIDELWKRLGE
jgi:hypothetical protein